MRHPLAKLIVALPMLALASCGRILVLADRPWWDAAGGDATLRRPLTLAALRCGYWPTVVEVPVQEDSRQRLITTLGAGRWKAAVVGPLLSLDAGELLSRFPAVRFILVDAPSASGGPSNAMRLVFDRAPAFKDAGAEAGALAREYADRTAAAQATARAPGSTSARPTVIAVIRSSSRATGSELEAFLEAARQSSGTEPIVVTVDEPVDEARLRKAVSDLRSRGVEIFLPWLAGQGTTFLRVLGELGGVAVVEDWAATRVLSERVLLSIDEDLVGGLAECFAQLGQGVTVVQGTVRITRGDARRFAVGPSGGR